MIFFLEKCLFHLNCEIFCKEQQKNLKFGKIREFDEERVFFEKKHSHPLKKPFKENWWAESMPVVAARLVYVLHKISKNTV